MTNLINTFKRLKVSEWVFILFSVIWVSFLTLDYWNKHPLYAYSLKYFRYPQMVIFMLLLGVLITLALKRYWLFKKIGRPRINGLLVLFGALLVILTVTVAFNKYWKAPLEAYNYLFICGLSLYVAFSTLLVLMSSISIGHFVMLKAVPLDLPPITSWLVKICLGFYILHLALFVLGAFQILNQWVVLGLLVSLTAVQAKFVFRQLVIIFWQPFELPKKLTVWGVFFLYGVFVMVVIHFMFSLAPFPLGFDARNYYVNIAKLIGEANGLVEGYQPYAWGLVMSTGYIAFKSAAVTLCLAIVGGVLSLFAVYELMVRYLKISHDFCAISLLLLVSTPAIVNHWIVEYKIDLTLLFTQLVVILLLLHWIYDSRKKKSANLLLASKKDIQMLVLMGVLLGFGLAIKALAIFLIAGIVILFWVIAEDIWGALGIALIGMGLTLIMQLDAQSGLRIYHENVLLTGFVSVGIGVMCLLISFVRNRALAISSLKTSLILAIIIGLSFSPWVGKNIVEGSTKSFSSLLLGQNPRARITYNEIIKNFEDHQKQNQNQQIQE